MSSYISDVMTDYDSNASFTHISNIHPTLIKSISKNIFSLLQPSQTPKQTPFTAPFLPSISVYDYISRIVEYTHIEKETLITSLIYINRFCAKTNFQITEYEIHRLLLTAIVLSIKYNEDEIYSQKHFAEVGGIEVAELNQLEFYFAEGIEFAFYVSDSEYECHFQSLNKTLYSNDKAQEKLIQIQNEIQTEFELDGSDDIDDEFETEEEIIIEF